jgi:hypothetical protein
MVTRLIRVLRNFGECAVVSGPFKAGAKDNVLK